MSRYLGILMIALLTACASSPLGRKQLTLIPSGQMNQMGIQSFEQMKQKQPIERSPAINQYIRCIVNPLIEASQGQSGVASWEVVVFQDSTPNAFALPGGKIGVHTGMLSVAKNDAQLAAVLGHEVGHVMANHGNERVSQGLLAQGGLMVADLLSGSASPERKQILMAGIGLGAQYGVLLPFSRSHESEADLIGLDLMSRAGFDPRQSVELWKNMAAASSGRSPPEFMSTHPANETRIQNLSQNLPANLQKYEQAQRAGLRPKCGLTR
jgi:predicted Zn-dependent protease